MDSPDQPFQLAHFPDESVWVCFSLDARRPDSYMEELEERLREMNYQGRLELDLFAANGNASNRFMRLNFDGARLDWLAGKPLARSALGARLALRRDQFYLDRGEPFMGVSPLSILAR